MPRERFCANPCSAGRLNGGGAGGHLRAVANREPNPGQPAVELDESRAEQVSSRSSRGMARAAWCWHRVVEVEAWVERAWWSVSPSVAFSPKRLMRSLIYGERSATPRVDTVHVWHDVWHATHDDLSPG